MPRAISLIVPLAFLILAAACGVSDTPTPTEADSTKQIAASSGDECKTNANGTASALWPYLRETNTVEDMYEFVDVTILGKVVGCTPGRVVQPSPIHAESHFTNVHIQIVEDWTKVPLPVNEITVEMPGGGTTPFYNDAPPFVAGEEYVLFLNKHFISIEARDANEPTPNTYFVINPQGRYRVENGALEAVSTDYILAKELDGGPVQSLKEEVDTLRLAK